MVMGFSIFQYVMQGKYLVNIRHYCKESIPENVAAPHKVDKLEKRFLVWTGKYKSLEEVPAFVGQNVMERTRNKMRIKIANYMMLATGLGCVLMIYLGKKDAKEGKSLQQQNIDWHKKINEDHKKEMSLAAAAQK